MERTLSSLQAEVGGEIVGDGERMVRGVATLDAAGPDHCSFFTNTRYKSQYLTSRAGVVIVGPDVAAGAERPEGATLLVHPFPYLAFAKVATIFNPAPQYPAGVDPRAAVDPTAEVDPSATVLPFAYVGPGVKVGARSVVHANCSLLAGATIEEDCILYPGVVVRDGCRVGARSILHPGAIVGGDGYGFAFDPENMRHFKVPQIGTVRIESDVEIGSNSCVDRGTLGDTVVGQGSKIDNLVQIAHNVELGPLCLLAGQSAIAGSTKLGTAVMLGGQVGVIGHLKLGDMAKVSAGSRVFDDVPGGGHYGGYPARPQSEFLREASATRRLPELLKEIRALKKRVETLEKGEG